MNLPSESLPLPSAYYDKNSGGFWYQDAKGCWIRFQQTDFVRFLKGDGYASRIAEGEIQSEIDQVIVEIQKKQNVDYAGPLAGYRQGLIEMGGLSILVTASPKIIKPIAGEYPMIQQVLLGMFGPEQLPYFNSWSKIAYESLASGNLRPGQALVLAGPRDSGKSLLQELITALLGGRCAFPHLNMTGGTTFNSELFGAEHQVIDDQVGSSDFKSRQKMTASFKMVTAAGAQQCHPKGKPALTLKPFWRLSISVNDEPESLLVLPHIREDVVDKLILFKIEKHEMPMPTAGGGERLAFWNHLMTELPHWIHFLVNEWQIPADLVGARFGVKHYHHPEIIEAMESMAPHMKLLNLLETEFGGHHHARPWIGTAAQLEAVLTADNSSCRYEARKLFHYQNSCGAYLAQLSSSHPNLARRDGRQNNQHLWRIEIPENLILPPPRALVPTPPPTPAPVLGLTS